MTSIVSVTPAINGNSGPVTIAAETDRLVVLYTSEDALLTEASCSLDSNPVTNLTRLPNTPVENTTGGVNAIVGFELPPDEMPAPGTYTVTALPNVANGESFTIVQLRDSSTAGITVVDAVFGADSLDFSALVSADEALALLGVTSQGAGVSWALTGVTPLSGFPHDNGDSSLMLGSAAVNAGTFLATAYDNNAAARKAGFLVVVENSSTPIVLNGGTPIQAGASAVSVSSTGVDLNNVNTLTASGVNLFAGFTPTSAATGTLDLTSLPIGVLKTSEGSAAVTPFVFGFSDATPDVNLDVNLAEPLTSHLPWVTYQNAPANGDQQIGSLFSKVPSINDRFTVESRVLGLPVNLYEDGFFTIAEEWATGKDVIQGQELISGSSIYISVSSGATGANAPTGTGSGIDDGGVTWDYVEAVGTPYNVETLYILLGYIDYRVDDTIDTLSIPVSDGSIIPPTPPSASKRISQIRIESGVLTINTNPVTLPNVFYQSPDGGLTEQANGLPLGNFTVNGQALEVGGRIISVSRTPLYISPDGRVTEVPNGTPVAELTIV